MRPALLDLGKVDGEWQWEWRFCVDGEGVQKRRILGGMMVAVSLEEEEKEAGGYELGWWVKALEVCNDDVNKARSWLGDWGRRVNE